MKEVAGSHWSDLSYALGGWMDRKKADNSLLDRRKDKWKLSIPMVDTTLQFAEAIGCLSYTYNTEINTGPSLL